MNMYKVGSYLPSDSMSDLICDNYPMLLVVSRFGIDLGVGDDSIEEVCSRSGVDLYTFLSVVNLLVTADKGARSIDYAQVSLPMLVEYLHNSHSYFLEYRLPMIRRELVEAVDPTEDVSVVMLNYYDEYCAEVRRHMMYEEETLFPYIRAVVGGEFDGKYSVGVYSEHHDRVESKLSELKNIIIKYYPAKTTNELNNVLYDIFSCERDLALHNRIEDRLLVPAIQWIESSKIEED